MPPSTMVRRDAPTIVGLRPQESAVNAPIAEPNGARNGLSFQPLAPSNTWIAVNRREVEPYTAEELKIASMQADLDGPLVDYAAKGTQIELAGKEKVENRDTYKLKLTMKNGQAIHVWIDAQTFLEAKIEGQPRRLDGVYHLVEVYYRDYRPVSGLQIPHILETKVLQVARTAQGFKDPLVPTEKIIIEKVVVNPKLDENRFSKPEIAAALNAK